MRMSSGEQSSTYIKCTRHNAMVIATGEKVRRFVHKSSNTICDSKNFVLVEAKVLTRGECFDWMECMERGKEVGAKIGVGNV